MKAPFRILAALVAGLVFGFGLALSGMVDPVRVRGFLDIAGDWDPSLAFVLAGAVFASALGVALSRRLARPVLDTDFRLPPVRPVDRRLLAGSALFGIGWGIAGLCPGPALTILPLGLAQAWLFVAAMAAGMVMHDRFAAAQAGSAPAAGE